MMGSIEVIYVDDYPLDRELVRHALEQRPGDFRITEARSRKEFEQKLEEGQYDVVLSDFNILGFEGLDIIDTVQAKNLNIPVIIVTGTGSEEVAVEAIRRGAADYVIKNTSHIKRLSTTIKAALENKRLERIAQQSHEVQNRLASAVEQATESIIITDAYGNIQYVNPAFELITGYKKEEVIGKNPRLLRSDQHDAVFYKQMLQTIRDGLSWKGRIASKRKDGKLFYEDVAISPVRDPSGKVVNYVDVSHDVTQRINLEEQLLQAQKMEAIGTLASGVAHDFNNLLQVIMGYSEILLLNKTPQDRDYEDLQRITTASRRGAELVQQLMAFSRKAQTRQCPTNLNQQIEKAEKLLSRTIPKMIEIVVNLKADLKNVNADPVQIDQVIMNLAVNAKDAMPDGGRIVIETSNVTLEEDYCCAHPELKPGSYVNLSVSDTGHGMGKETVARIFEPFYTTKEQGKGTGLGLAMVYGIVHQHSGSISCCSQPGQGTTFTMYFPTIEDEKAPDMISNVKVHSGGTETILFVDDDEAVRELGARSLGRSGYNVMVCACGEETLDLYSKKGNEIQLVVLDLIMPGMGGKKCLEELLKINPQVKSLIASGIASDEIAKECIQSGAKGLVSKPYNLDKLLRAVREALDRD